jgi:hypothetical protein
LEFSPLLGRFLNGVMNAPWPIIVVGRKSEKGAECTAPSP